jgi:hypothetical protein
MRVSNYFVNSFFSVDVDILSTSHLLFCGADCSLGPTVPWRLLFHGAYCSMAPTVPWHLLYPGIYCSVAVPRSLFFATQNPQFQEEKISARKQARSHVNMEKSSKNLISVFGEKPARGLPKPPPTPPRREIAEFTHGKNAIPGRGRGIRTRIWDTEKGRGGNNAKLNNSQRNNILTPDFKQR